ncbi:MAG: T9SS type A sorting domain-containing protein [Saprospiraceae bacterium]
MVKLFFQISFYTNLFLGISNGLTAQRVLEVGPGKTFSNPQLAILQAKPGDTVLMYPAVYSGDYYIENLKGTSIARITVKGTDVDKVIIEGSQAFQFAEIEFVNIQDFSIRGQSVNGINIDDGGTYITPAKHVLVGHIKFLGLNATGNNDMLKLSGLDSFEVRDCEFNNGSEGGSGIDMVGCHAGWIHNLSFRNQGSNSIQAKGGCKDLHIERNSFINGGSRTLNLGGSTGQLYFRPLGVNYEAKDILVNSNFFEGSEAPIGFVGCRNVQVSNNTFYNPLKWIFRILQESSDTSFYLSCANNTFSNNIIFAKSINPTINIGPYTSEGTFKINNNLWFSSLTTNWRGPILPVVEKNGIYGLDPLLEDVANGNIKLKSNSPAIANGLKYNNYTLDFYNKFYKKIPVIGAAEHDLNTNNNDIKTNGINIFPNPCIDYFNISGIEEKSHVEIYNMIGEMLISLEYGGNETIDVSKLIPSSYIIKIKSNNTIHSLILIKK